MTRFAALVLGGAFLTSAHAAPPMKSETAMSGNVRATIVYRATRGETVYRIRLFVSRAGKTVLDETVPSYSRRSLGTWPGALSGRKSVAVRDLDGDGDGEPEIVLCSAAARQPSSGFVNWLTRAPSTSRRGGHLC